MRNAKLLLWLTSVAVWGGGAGACRRATAPVQTNTTNVQTAAAPAPQPSVCAAENVSRAAFLRQAQTSASPAPTAPSPRQSSP